jgi:hypothetical protein
VYLLSRPDGSPFYVGKGVKRRVLEHEAEARRAHQLGESNPHKCNTIRKIIREGAEICYHIDSIFSFEEESRCLEREAALIRRYRRLHEGGCLTNLAGGVGNLSGSSPESLAKHAATLAGDPVNNPARAILNHYLQSIGPIASVPVKPLSQLKPVLPTTPHPLPRQPKARNAYALVASAAAHGVPLLPGARIPRCFRYEGVDAIIENGVARDILKADLATLESVGAPTAEVFVLDAEQARMIVQLVGRSTLERMGLI